MNDELERFYIAWDERFRQLAVALKRLGEGDSDRAIAYRDAADRIENCRRDLPRPRREAIPNA